MGILYIVATPIGNLEDLSLRALRILKEVDLIVCEDTRQTLKLLNHYNISKPLVSYFQHSKFKKVEYIIEQLRQGKNLALVTDAGTPGISDPGNKLIAQLLFPERSEAESKGLKAKFYPSINSGNNPSINSGNNPSINSGNNPSINSGCKISPPLKIVPIPGPNAAIAALSVSGFPTDKFIFLGFPPHKKGRQKFFKEIARAKYTIVFYESPYRILKTLNQLNGVLPSGRGLVVCRELTKLFESIYRGNAQEVIKILESNKNNLRGEFVIVVSHG